MSGEVIQQDGTIDITDLVENMRTTFVTWAEKTIYAYVVSQPWGLWVSLPVCTFLFNKLLNKIFNFLSKQAVMMAFFKNTAIRKSSQAKDYISALEAKKKLPPTATDDEYEKAELHEISMFNNFVKLSN